MKIAVATIAPAYRGPQAECIADALRGRGHQAFATSPGSHGGRLDCDVLFCIGSGESLTPLLAAAPRAARLLYLVAAEDRHGRLGGAHPARPGARLDGVDAVQLEYHSEADRLEIDQLLCRRFALHHARAEQVHRGTLGYVSRTLIAARTRLDDWQIARPTG